MCVHILKEYMCESMHACAETFSNLQAPSDLRIVVVEAVKLVMLCREYERVARRQENRNC